MGAQQIPVPGNMPNADGQAGYNGQHHRPAPRAQEHRPPGPAPPAAVPEQPQRPAAGGMYTPPHAAQTGPRRDFDTQAGSQPFGCGRGGFGLVQGGAAAGRGFGTGECGSPWGMRYLTTVFFTTDLRIYRHFYVSTLCSMKLLNHVT